MLSPGIEPGEFPWHGIDKPFIVETSCQHISFTKLPHSGHLRSRSQQGAGKIRLAAKRRPSNKETKRLSCASNQLGYLRDESAEKPSTHLGGRDSNPQHSCSQLKLRRQLGQKRNPGNGVGNTFKRSTIELSHRHNVGAKRSRTFNLYVTIVECSRNTPDKFSISTGVDAAPLLHRQYIIRKIKWQATLTAFFKKSFLPHRISVVLYLKLKKFAIFAEYRLNN